MNVLLQEKPDWDTAKKVLNRGTFLQDLKTFDKDRQPKCCVHESATTKLGRCRDHVTSRFSIFAATSNEYHSGSFTDRGEHYRELSGPSPF